MMGKYGRGKLLSIQKSVLKKARKGIYRNRISQRERDVLDYLVAQELIRSRCDVAPDFYLISEAGQAYLSAVFKDNVRYNITTGISVAALIVAIISLAVSLMQPLG